MYVCWQKWIVRFIFIVHFLPQVLQLTVYILIPDLIVYHGDMKFAV
jgi:hypothetical protein